VTALHVVPPTDEIDVLRRPSELVTVGRSLVKSIKELGARVEINVTTLVKVLRSPERAILRQAGRGGHNLIIVGVNLRSGEKVFFGRRIAVLLEKSTCPILLVNSSGQTKIEKSK
jgi:nucleotide-binding universal stress UspA family protein